LNLEALSSFARRTTYLLDLKNWITYQIICTSRMSRREITMEKT